MKITYRIEIGIRKGQGRILLKEKVEFEEKLMKDLLEMLMNRKPMTITNAIKILELAADSTIESIEIRED